MNISTTPRQWALAFVSVLCLLTGQKIQAQCPITTIPPAPVNVQVVVNQITGMATFSSNDVTGIISTSAPCDPVSAYKIRFYEDEAKTLPYSWTGNFPGCLLNTNGGGSTVPLSCADINTTKQVWAAINDGNAPGGDPCGEFDASSESAAVLFNVNVLDQTAPEALAPANITVNAGASCTATAIAGISMNSVVKVAHPSVLALGQYTDNCLSNVTVSYYLTGATVVGTPGSPVSGSNAGVQIFALGTTTVTYIITDTKYTPGSGTTPVTVSFTVTGVDAPGPGIACPAHVNVNTTAGICTAPASLTATTTDNCGSSLSWSAFTFSNAPNLAIPDNACPALTTTTIPVAGIGVLGGAGKRLKGVTLFLTHTFTGDLELTLAAPGGATLDLSSDNGGSNDHFFVNFVDGAPSITGIPNSGGLNSGTAQAPYQAAAEGGLLTSFNGVNADGNWELRVCDDANIDVGIVKYWHLQFEDVPNPVVPTAGTGGTASATFPLGVSSVHFLAADAAGNVATCVRTVTVTDNENPTFAVSPTSGLFNATPAAGSTSNLGTSTAPGAPQCDGTYSWRHPDVSDNCTLAFPPATLTMELSGMTVLGPVAVLEGANYTQTFNGLGNTTVKYVATDNNGKTASYTFIINVIDDVAPVVAPVPGNQNFVVNAAMNACTELINYTRPSIGVVTDCGAVTMMEMFISGPDPDVLDGQPAFNTMTGGGNINVIFPTGTTVIRYLWKDASPDSPDFWVDYTFTVVETQAPTALCTPGVVSLDQYGYAVVPPALINNGSSDNCGAIMSMSVTPPFFDCTAIGTNPNPVTLTVTDNNGNAASCNTTVFVQDITAPVIGCPSSFQVNADGTCNGTVAGLIFDVTTNVPPSPGTLQYWDNSWDQCDLAWDLEIDGGGISQSGTVTFVASQIDLSTTMFDPGASTVTLRLTDDSGNIAACNFNVTVEDGDGPTYADCPANISMSAAAGGCGKIVSWVPPTWSDNCTAPVTDVVNSHNAAGTFFGLGTTIVSHTATDDAGNRTTCSFTVTITDGQPPVAICKPATVTLAPGNTVVMPASAIDNNSTDNCFYTYQTASYTFDCSHVGTPQTVILSIIDNGGNTASCSATVTVLDGVAPTALCNLIPTTLNLSASDCTAPIDPGLVRLTASNVGNATDNCPAAVTYQISVDGSSFVNQFDFNCSHIGVRQVVLKATDSAGSSTCGPVAITINDVSAPCFTVPASLVLDCNDSNANLLNPTNTGSPTNVNDNCDAAPTVSYLDFITTVPGCPNALNISRVWTITDHAVVPNSSSQTQTIQVRDITGPVWTLGTSFSANTTGPTVCTVASPIPAVVAGTNISDACGSFTVTYGINYPAGSGQVNVANGTPLPLNGLIPNVFPIGVSTVTFVAVDECSNQSTRTVTVTVTDVHAPQFNYSRCGNTYTLPNTTNSCDQLYTWTRPVLADLFDCRTYTVTETIGNTSVQQFVNLVNPFVWPTTPPVNTNVVAQFPVGPTTVTYTATDGTNTSTCTFVVKIEDTQAPTITCPMNQTLPITAGCTSITTVPNYTTLSAVTDNCPNNIIFTQSPAATSLVSNSTPVVPGNSFVVTLQATDGQPLGLSSAICSFTVTLIDGQAPVPNLPVLPAITSFCGKDTVDAPSALDCNGVTFVTIYGTPSVPVMMTLPPLVVGGPPRYVLNQGNYVITWSYTDAQNNTTTQPQNVSIAIDNIPPTAICQSLTVDLNANGTVTVNAPQVDNGSFDQHNCGPVSFSFRTGTNPSFVYVPSLAFGCSNLGANAVVFAATDVNNNTATCATTITVRDVTKPIIGNVPNDTTIQACANIPAQAVLTASDVCDSNVPVLATQTTTQDSSFEVCAHYNYTITRKWTASDDSGNTQTVTQIITVVDNQAPVFSSPDSIVVLTDPNRTTCNDTVFLNMLAYISDCVPDSELVVTNTLNPQLGADITGVFALGSHTVTFTATDKCGNSSTKSIKLVVRDATLPTAVCINGISVSLQSGGTVSIGVTQVNNNSFDNCGIASMQVQRLNPNTTLGNSITFNCNDADAVTQHPVRLVVRDLSGNESACETFVVVQDNVPPTITCPTNLTVLCNANTDVSSTGAATATDNCPILPNAISFADTMITGTGSTCHILRRIWMARDLSGNISQCNQDIALLDTIKPVLSVYPPDITISCSDPVPNPSNVTATDNCDQTLVVSFEQDTINIAPGNCGKYDYTIVRTRTVSDDCGNTEIDLRRIKVVDNTPPRFLGMPNTVTFESANFPPNNNCTVPVNFDAGQYFVECAPLSECTLDAIQFIPAVPGLTPVGLNVSGIYPIGTTKVIFSVTDPCGNKGRDTIDIIVVDNSVPTMVCNNNVVIALGSNGDASIDPADIDLGSLDNCAIDTLFLDQQTFDCADLGFNTVRLTAVDIYGNSNFCEVEVEVTLGANAGFNLSANGVAESFFGAGDGLATAVVGGGSGTFTYEWSNQATIPTIGNLAAGSYIVTVIDSNTGCVSVDTAVVNPGPKVTVNVGTIDGCQGQSIVIPVSVDNFINVSGFSFGLQLDNATVGAITGITDVNPAITGLTPGVSSVFWTNGNPTVGINLPNGSLLFNLHVTLAGPPTALGTTSTISASALPALVFLQPIAGVPTPAGMITFNNGAATINCPAADIDIAGEITTWKAPVQAIPNVNVALTGTQLGADVTALPLADYSFLISAGSNTIVTPSKVATGKSTKINVGDLLFIQAHAAPPPVQIPFTSPYQWLAADINSDKNVNIVDYALVQAYIVNNALGDGNFNFNPMPPAWKFVPKAYVFPAPNPLNPTPPSNITRNNVVMDFLDDDFIGVLLGDVNGDVTPTNAVGGGGTESQGFKFRISDRSVQTGEIVTIPFKAKDFIDQQAYQLTIVFDPEKFELQGIVPGVLPGIGDANFGTSMLSEGLLGALWVGNKPISLNDNEVLFSLTFKAIESVNSLAEVLRPGAEIAEPMVVDGTGNIQGIDFEFTNAVATGEIEFKSFALFQNQPNPFSESTHISFRLPEASRARLNIFGTDGRLVKTIIGDYAAGNNTITIRKDELGQSGVYWYELETNKHSDRKKMILLD
ncbi:MAG: HYR domain-containing protein [Saprospiraceae bacterium]|nr:HYR domain-containing protein [Saprospiraceae bacterium]